MSSPNASTCKTLNWPACNKAIKCAGALGIWFDPDMAWVAQPTGKRGRHPVYSDAVVQTVCSDAAVRTCLPMEVLSGMASRQRTGFVESLLCLIGPDWDVPDFNPLSRRRTTLAVNIPLRRSQAPLQLLIDSTAIKVAVEGEKERNARKHAGPKRRA